MRYGRESDCPDYLARHYWWAYLWPPAARFFDRQLVINSILFGQYPALLDSAVRTLGTGREAGRVLQLTCAYGNLTPRLLDARDDSIFLVDVLAGQLELARNKVGPADRGRLLLARMNAECLAFRDESFGTVIIFFFRVLLQHLRLDVGL